MEARQGDRNVAGDAVLAQGCVGRTREAASGRRNEQMVIAAKVLQ